MVYGVACLMWFTLLVAPRLRLLRLLILLEVASVTTIMEHVHNHIRRLRKDTNHIERDSVHCWLRRWTTHRWSYHRTLNAQLRSWGDARAVEAWRPMMTRLSA
eukprot:3811587-Amphidinium_carterae.2